MLTAYDFPTARLLDEAGIPVLLVGDSLAQVVLGYDTTLPVTMDEMLHHCRAVARGASKALLIGDMPFGSYQVSVEEGIRNATRFLKEGGMHGVKIEGPNLELTQALTERGVPVMAHLGLTPQSGTPSAATAPRPAARRTPTSCWPRPWRSRRPARSAWSSRRSRLPWQPR